MTSRRAQRRTRPRRALPDDQHYATTPAWAQSPEDLPEARQQSHDMLLAMMAAQDCERTGPVRWLTYEGENAHNAVRELGSHYHADSHQAGIIRRLHRTLDEWGGFLVVALAPGKPPVKPSSPAPEVPM